MSNLSPDGKAWYLHPVGMMGFAKKDLIDVESFITLYTNQHEFFAPGTRKLNHSSKQNLILIIEKINLFYDIHPEYISNIYYVAYMLATARHEASYGDDYFGQLVEVGNISYFSKYDPVLANTSKLREKAQKYGNTLEGDGYKYRGRGLVQLTWKMNYQKATDYFNIDFVNDPDKAAEYEYAVPIMIWGMTHGIFSEKSLSKYINENSIDYKRARYVINGKDQRDLIASYATRFEFILRQTSTLTEDFNND